MSLLFAEQATTPRRENDPGSAAIAVTPITAPSAAGEVILLQALQQPIEPSLELFPRLKARSRSKNSMAGYSPVFWKWGEQRHSMTGAFTAVSAIWPRTCS